MKKTLEASIADRLVQLSCRVSGNKDAFENHLTILDRALLVDDLPTLRSAVKDAAGEFGMMDDHRVKSVLHYIDETLRRAS